MGSEMCIRDRSTRVDLYGFNIKTVIGVAERDIYPIHNGMQALVQSDMERAGIKVTNGHQLFARLVNGNDLDDDSRICKRIIPDLVVRDVSVGGARSSTFGGKETL